MISTEWTEMVSYAQVLCDNNRVSLFVFVDKKSINMIMLWTQAVCLLC